MKEKIKLFSVGDLVIAFNDTEWSKTGDLPEGNDKYFQKAIILKFRRSKNEEDITDVVFENGQQSNGHFLNNLNHC